jgi:hypothetical protein
MLPELDLRGRSLTTREYMDACWKWFDAPSGRRDANLEDAIAYAEARRMIDRFNAGEPWEHIRAESRRGPGPEPT